MKVVVTDMADCYRKAIRKHLPGACHVVDRFHAVRNFSKALVSARRGAQRTARGKPHKANIFYNRFLLMKRCDRLTGDETARLGQIFDEHPELGVVCGLVQRFHVIFEAEDETAANTALDAFTDAYQNSGVNLGAAVTSFCRWGQETLAFHLPGNPTNARAEGVNAKIECLERMAYGFTNRTNYTARVLLACTGHPTPTT